MFECSEFPDKLKLADVSPIFKADDSTLKFNSRPISVLPALSKVLERIMAKQVTPFANTRLSSLLCGFCDGYRTHHALFRLIEACRSTLDKKGCVGMVLMDLSKAYDCLSHDLLIAKLAAYGFGLKSLNLFSSYLSNRKQRVKYGNSFRFVILRMTIQYMHAVKALSTLYPISRMILIVRYVGFRTMEWLQIPQNSKSCFLD